MTLAGLSFAYLRDRALNTALNILLLALGVATLVILLLFSAQLEGRFERDAEGIDMVVGAKGSPLQLILSSIYHVDVPTGNIPLGAYEMLRKQPTVAEVIPLALGDSFRSFRIVGTEPAYPALYGGKLADGRMFAKPFEAVIGSDVAARTGATLGQRFVGSHGMGDSDMAHKHEETPFIVVGRLAPTGTVIDRLIMTPVESVWDVHGIAHDEAHEHEHDHDHEDEHEHEHEHEHEDAHADEAVPRDAAVQGELAPEVTALLVRFGSPLAAVQLPNFINRQTELQAAVPAVEISRLLALLGIGIDAVRAFAVLLMLTAGLSIFVALLTALRQREGDMAMLRVIGASRAGIMGQIIAEGLILAAAGALLGVVLGHAVIGVAASSFEELRQLGLSALHFEPAELWIVLAALAIGVVAALVPAIRVFNADIAETLAEAR
jgi:putative ABC transport system permease protein